MTTIAPIVAQLVSKVRFCVDDVETAPERLPVKNAKLQLEQYFERQVLAFSHADAYSTIQSLQIHPLVHAVHKAFSEHRPLLLTPDIVWITLAQGFAQHVNNHAETLRSRFVRHQGKQALVVKTLQRPTLSQQWRDAIQQWVLQIRDHVGPDLYRFLECNFSTTTSITHTASHVVMMDTFQQYFDYEMLCVCGIPEITLEGSVEDWMSLYGRVQSMTQYELSWWTERLLPICQEFVETASGKPSLEFWRAIYKPKEIYGGELITGWLAELFPYIKHPITQQPSVQNPMLGSDRLDLAVEEQPSMQSAFQSFGFEAQSSVQNPMLSIDRRNLTVKDGISPQSLPLGLSQVPLKLQSKDESGKETNDALALVGGFIGVAQTEDGTLQPEIGWAVLEQNDPFAALLDKIQQEHMTQPPVNWDEFNSRWDCIPKELIQLLNRFNGATLYAHSNHAWQLTKYNSASARVYQIHRQDPFSGLVRWDLDDATHLIDLEDGRCIAFNLNWLVVGQPVKRIDARPQELCQFKLENAVIIAGSIPQLFERIFAAEGLYYFDDPAFVPMLVDDIFTWQ